ncbi:integrator complex subunit 8-like isoform X2 [Oscarella lobularis]
MAYVLYYRWIARGLLRASSLKTIIKRLGETLPPALNWNKDQMLATLKPSVNDAIRVLTQATRLQKDLPLPLFKVDSIDRKSKLIKSKELQCLAAYDLAELFVFQNNYSAAVPLFSQCMTTGMPAGCLHSLSGYLAMFSLENNRDGSLSEQLEEMQKNKFYGVIELLKKNILNRELGYQCQLDIEEQLARQAASVVGGALLHSHACLCNGLASVIDGRLVSASFWALFDKRGPADSKKSELVAFLCQTCMEVIGGVSLEARQSIKTLLWEICYRLRSRSVVSRVLASEVSSLLFSDEERKSLESSWKGVSKPADLKMVEIPPGVPVLNEWNSQVASFLSEVSLASRPAEINSLISKIESLSVHHRREQDVDEIFNTQFGRHLHSRDLQYLYLIPDPHNRHTCCLFLYKAQKFTELECYDRAVEMLRAARDNVYRGAPLAILDTVEQRLLLAEILQTRATDYRKINPPLLKRVRGFVQDSMRPDSLAKPELVESVVICLMNARDWSFLVDQNQFQSEAWYHLVACSKFLTQPVKDPSYCERATTTFWEAVSVVFSSDQPAMNARDRFVSFVLKIKDGTILNVLVSCLANLYNVMCQGKDGSIGASLLSASMLGVWPTSVMHFERIQIDAVSSSLSTVLDHALSVSGANAHWLLTKADLLFVTQKFKASLNAYIEAGAAASGFFEKPVAPELWTSEVYRRLIQICNTLEYHIQAAVICQCVVPVERATAFKSIQLAISRDPVDVYHGFFWDIPILENIIHLHAKRGEHEKKQLAILAIGQPELNSCNAPEILEKAISSRKCKFFQLMANRFLT